MLKQFLQCLMIFFIQWNKMFCVMVWGNNKPHDTTTKTYFGYYKEDGFVKKKEIRRVDIYEME